MPNYRNIVNIRVTKLSGKVSQKAPTPAGYDFISRETKTASIDEQVSFQETLSTRDSHILTTDVSESLWISELIDSARKSLRTTTLEDPVSVQESYAAASMKSIIGNIVEFVGPFLEIIEGFYRGYYEEIVTVPEDFTLSANRITAAGDDVTVQEALTNSVSRGTPFEEFVLLQEQFITEVVIPPSAPPTVTPVGANGLSPSPGVQAVGADATT